MIWHGRRARLSFPKAVALLASLMALTGCGNSYVSEKMAGPGGLLIDPRHIVAAVIFFGLIGPAGTVLALYALVMRRRAFRTGGRNFSLELWVSRRKLPVPAGAILVPVAPDLKMVFGIAKIVRDYGADAVQNEANRVAPLRPGEAFVGTGGRYRYRYTALAVIFDEAKRTGPELICSAVLHAMELLNERGVGSVLFPDMTENLLTQPTWITEEQRQQTAEITAQAMVDAALACRGLVRTIRFWVWDPRNTGAFRRALEKVSLAEAEETAVYPRIAEIHGAVVRVVRGDIAVPAADAIFLTTSGTTSGMDGSSSPEAVPEAAADLEESSEDASVPLPLEPSEGIPLGGAGMGGASQVEGARQVISLATRTPQIPASTESILSALEAGLKLADDNGLHTLLLPNLGAGRNNYPIMPLAPLLLNTVANYLDNPYSPTAIRQIYLIAADADEEAAFGSALAGYLPELPLRSPRGAAPH